MYCLLTDVFCDISFCDQKSANTEKNVMINYENAILCQFQVPMMQSVFFLEIFKNYY